MLPWIDVAYEKLMQELKEPLGSDPENVRAQMDRIKALHDDIVLHTKDVEKLKDGGRELANTQDQIKDDVLRTVGK